MDLIFIDANIYLTFFQSEKEFKKLLSSLKEISPNIFITRQIVNEVERNKLGKFKEYLKGIDRPTIDKLNVVTHIESDKIAKISDWEKKRNKVKQDFEDLKKEFDNIMDSKLKEIYNSTDEVSKILFKIYKLAIEETPEELSRARLRKERGNPPGKKGDTLGDQISWEQLISIAHLYPRMWIVSKDGDFIDSGFKEPLLNPLLFNELKGINPKVEVYSFTSLTDALTSYNKKVKIKNLPPQKELDKIILLENSEEFMNVRNVNFENFPKDICPNCGTIYLRYHGNAEPHFLMKSCSMCGYIEVI